MVLVPRALVERAARCPVCDFAIVHGSERGLCCGEILCLTCLDWSEDYAAWLTTHRLAPRMALAMACREAAAGCGGLA